MASDSAWSEGWAQGREASQHRRDRKEMLSDEERQQKASDLITTRNSLLSKLPTLLGPNGEKTQEYNDAYQSLTQAQEGLGQLYHPDKAPGALQKDWHFLLEKMHGITGAKDKTPPPAPPQASSVAVNTPAPPSTTPAIPADPSVGQDAVPATTMPGMNSVPKGATPTMAVAKPKGLVEAGTIPIWNRPSVLNDDGTHSSELSISMGDDKGNQVLIPLIVGGKFLTPDGKMPPGPIPHNAQEWEKASPEWKALKMRAWQNYEKTGEHLGKFGGETAEDDVDAYAQVLHNRGANSANSDTLPTPPVPVATKAPKPTWGQAQVLKHKAAAMQKAQQEASLLASAAPLSLQQEAVLQAKAQSAARYANLQGDMASWDKDNPNAPKDDRNAQYNQLYQKWFGTTGKGSWKTVSGTITDPADPSKKTHVSYLFDGNTKQYANEDGTPVRQEFLATFTPDLTTSSAKYADYQAAVDKGYEGSFSQYQAEQAARGRGSIAGLKYDKSTGQILDPSNGKTYSSNDEYLPPEVKKKFEQQAILLKKQQDFQLKMAGVRGAAYNMTKPMITLDSTNGNAPTVVTFGDMQKHPGRYVPATEADKALVKENLMQDIAGSSKATRKAINDLKEDFPVDMQAKMAIAMKSEDPPDSLNQLFPAEAINSLSEDQQRVFIAIQQLVEQGMAMRSVLGAGQGSDTMRAAMRTTLPSVMGPNKKFAMMQLDAFDATVKRLHRGVPNIKLNETPMAGSTILPASSGNIAAKNRADYKSFLVKNPLYEKSGGTYDKWIEDSLIQALGGKKQ